MYVDDACVISKPREGFMEMLMTVNVTIFEAAILTVSEKKPKTMLFQHDTRRFNFNS